MKKVLLLALMAFTSYGVFAAEGLSAGQKEKTAFEDPAASSPQTGVHISGTMVSSCGVTWNINYDCNSGCTFSGTLTNLDKMRDAINAACSTGQTEIRLYFSEA